MKTCLFPSWIDTPHCHPIKSNLPFWSLVMDPLHLGSLRTWEVPAQLLLGPQASRCVINPWHQPSWLPPPVWFGEGCLLSFKGNQKNAKTEVRQRPPWELGKWKCPLTRCQEKRWLSHIGAYCWRNIKSCFLRFSLIVSLSEVPTKMAARLHKRVALSAERYCTTKIRMKSRGNQAIRKVGYVASRGRQTPLQEGPRRKSRSVTAGNIGDAQGSKYIELLFLPPCSYFSWLEY